MRNSEDWFGCCSLRLIDTSTSFEYIGEELNEKKNWIPTINVRLNLILGFKENQSRDFPASNKFRKPHSIAPASDCLFVSINKLLAQLTASTTATFFIKTVWFHFYKSTNRQTRLLIGSIRCNPSTIKLYSMQLVVSRAELIIERKKRMEVSNCCRMSFDFPPFKDH